jgi:hypothetical protein
MENELIQLIKCPKCGQEKPADSCDKHICVDCARAENNRYSHIRQHQGDWMVAAKDAGIDVWLQQPGETQWEYTIWCAFRDSYPGRKATYGQVAQQLQTTNGVVKKVAQRWSFQARMQAWMAECDRITLEQRRQEVLDMNAEHVSMAKRLRDKLSMAIDLVEPTALKPTDLATLMKLSTELERKARLDEMEQDGLRREALHDFENPDIKKSPTKTDDLGEVVKILLGAGALGNITQIGVRETKEIVVKGDEDDYYND